MMENFDPNHCPPEELAAFVVSVNEEHRPDWNQHIVYLFHQINDRKHLETLGRSATPKQTLAVIDYCVHAAEQSKFASFLIGTSQQAFLTILSEANNRQMQVLKREIFTEPVQHHLTLFIHDMSIKIGEYTQKIAEQEKEIETLIPDQTPQKAVIDLFNRIDESSQLFTAALYLTNQALALSWNTMRLDLIEKLSAVKDVFHKFNSLVVGHPKTADFPSRGLYAKLEEKLFSLYGTPGNPLELLSNDSSAFEALGRLNLWYLKDYWEVGLLPSVKEAKLLEVTPKKREILTQEVQKTLEKLGLKTVQNLKDFLIYSTESLKSFVLSKNT